MNAPISPRILQDLTKLSQADLIRMLIEAQQKPARKISFKVTDKGGCSVYGMGRFPVTLYATQWRQLIQALPELEAFLTTNASRLTSKPE